MASEHATQPIAPETSRSTLSEYAVLGLLCHLGEPISGYDLRKVIDSSVGYIWQPSKTHVYVVLRHLEHAGLATRREVEQRGKPDKQLYEATAAGRAAVRTWLERDEDVSDPDRSILLLKLFFGAQADRNAIVRQLTAFRDSFARRLETYESMQVSPRDRVSDEFTRLTLRYGIERARASLDWADAALEELNR
jgi:PadR family transcriptional regulator, regulatory protein AphA